MVREVNEDSRASQRRSGGARKGLSKVPDTELGAEESGSGLWRARGSDSHTT